METPSQQSNKHSREVPLRRGSRLLCGPPAGGALPTSSPSPSLKSSPPETWTPPCASRTGSAGRQTREEEFQGDRRSFGRQTEDVYGNHFDSQLLQRRRQQQASDLRDDGSLHPRDDDGLSFTQTAIDQDDVYRGSHPRQRFHLRTQSDHHHHHRRRCAL